MGTNTEYNAIIGDLERYFELTSSKRPKGYREATKKQLRFYLEDYLKNAGTIDRRSFISWLADINLAKSTKRYLSISLCRFLLAFKYIDETDSKIIKELFEYKDNNWSNKLINEDIVLKTYNIFKSTNSHFHKIRNLAMHYIFTTLGLRISQLINIKKAKTIVEDERITIEVPLLKKSYDGTAVKSIPLNYGISEYNGYSTFLPYWNYIKNKETEYLFISERYRQISKEMVRHLYQNVSKKIGVRIYPHIFRHYVATLVANNVGVVPAAKLLDHENIQTTQKYLIHNRMDGNETYNIFNLMLNK